MRGLGLMDRNGGGVHLGCHRFRDDLKTTPQPEAVKTKANTVCVSGNRGLEKEHLDRPADTYYRGDPEEPVDQLFLIRSHGFCPGDGFFNSPKPVV